MIRRSTIGELAWPSTPEFTAVARNWQRDASAALLRLVWTAYDTLRANLFSNVDCTQADDEVERSITQYLEPEIQRAMSGLEPFYVQHGSFEFETRKPAPAQSPAYDIAFVLRADPRVMWPLEAKVLRTDAHVTAYVADVLQEFGTCRYAPFSSEGGMLGYLISGTATQAFANIASALSCVLDPCPSFPTRDHRVSAHTRTVPAGRTYPARFTCHHLILLVAAPPGSVAAVRSVAAVAAGRRPTPSKNLNAKPGRTKSKKLAVKATRKKPTTIRRRAGR